jgi:DNA-binding NtrC family response regulator
MMAMTDMIDVVDLPVGAQRPGAADAFQSPHAATSAAATSAQSLEEHEKKLVMEALQQAAGNQSQAARQLRIGRDALRYKMKKFGLL